MKILVLGITGMLGHRLILSLQNMGFDVYGTIRNEIYDKSLLKIDSDKIIKKIDAANPESIFSAINNINPEVVINCIGVIKQKKESQDYVTTIQLNSLFPHQVAEYCDKKSIRFIHISTDCVFDGSKGNYSEDDLPDANDLYGRSKALGEVIEYKSSLTIRTSIIGHEINSKLSLLEWFLSQEEQTNGYTGAIYSGLTTNELSAIIGEVIIPKKELNGLLQIASSPISKYDLLKIVSKTYDKNIRIIPHDVLQENKTLNSDLFKNKTGYIVPSWEKMIQDMYNQEYNQ